jgi:tetratricopeptide (TPR) repeat protein
VIKQSHHSRWVRSVALIALAGVLVWQVITKNFAAYLALGAPEVALNFHSSQPVALVTLADARLNQARTESGSDRASIPQQASPTKTEMSEDAGDRIGAWAELALRAARKTLPPGKTDRSQKPNAAPQLARPPATEAVRNEARAQAELALAGDPLNARALRILGQIADGTGNDTKAALFMQAAADRSWSASGAIYWLILKSFEKGDYATALRYTDAFLRKRPQFMAQAMPVLVQIAENKDENAVGALKALLAGNPPWRSSFFSNLHRTMTDARTPLQLLLAAKETTSPPTITDISGYLNFLVGRKFYELAYYTWLQFLPPEQLSRAGFLINGSFEVAPSGLPFDWVILGGSSGVTTDITLRPELDGEHALYLEFGPGRADFRGVSQLLMLAPGTYELKGLYKGEIIGLRGLQWSITCAGQAHNPIGESRMFLGTARAWTDFVIPFTVPDADCRAQKLRLSLTARSASERLVSGSIWYDKMQISRVETSNLTDQTLSDKSPKHDAHSPPDVTPAKGSENGDPSPGTHQQSGAEPKVGQ